MNGVTRRKFVMTSGIAFASIPVSLSRDSAGEARPWYRKVRRCGQTNMNEKDLLGVDVEAWADYWASLKIDVVLLNGGGIVAYYPTSIPYHHRSKFLTD